MLIGESLERKRAPVWYNECEAGITPCRAILMVDSDGLLDGRIDRRAPTRKSAVNRNAMADDVRRGP